MIQNFVKILSKEISGLHEAAYLLAFFAFASQILALVRDKLFAYTFGASHILDLYYASFRIPDIVYATIASTVAASILVPFLVRDVEISKARVKYFIDNVFSVFFVAITIVSVVLWFLVPLLVPKFLPGFSHDKDLGLLIGATRIMLLSPILLGISNFLASITQMYNRFLIYALSPLLYNLGIIVGILFLYPIFGLYGLSFGVILGAFLHMAFQAPYVFSQKLFPKFTFKIDWKEIREVVAVSFPRTVTLASTEIAKFFLIAVATVMGEGSVSIFNFSWNLQSVPLAIIGVSYSSAAFPTLAKLFSSKNVTKYVEHMVTTAKHIIFWSMPVMVLFIVLRAQIVRTILGAGQFDWSDTRLTAAMLALFTISVVGQSLILLFVRAYYAEGKTQKPLYVNVISMISIIGMAYLFKKLFVTYPTFLFFVSSLFKVEDLAGSSILALSLAYTLGIIINTGLHWWLFHNDYGGFKGKFTMPVLKTLFQSFGAWVSGGYVAYWGLQAFSFFLNLRTVLGIFFQGFFAGIVGIIIAICILKLLKSEELSEAWKTLHHKIWKAKIVVPEQESL